MMCLPCHLDLCTFDSAFLGRASPAVLPLPSVLRLLLQRLDRLDRERASCFCRLSCLDITLASVLCGAGSMCTCV